jgi:D-alanine-D-alanine ligase
MKVAVLMGGKSPEREISLRSGENVARELESAGFEVLRVDPDGNLISLLKEGRVEAAFLALHGPNGEDGRIQGLLEFAGIPFTGSGVLASALAMDKVMSKRIFENSGIPTPSWIMLEGGEIPDEKGLSSIGWPVVVKPSVGGSTIGITIARDRPALEAAVELARLYCHQVLLERYLPGTEITVGVLGADELQVLPVMEIVPVGGFYNYETKYVPGMSTHITPARIPQGAYSRAQELALAAHRVLGCFGMSRVDMIVSKDEEVMVLEVNTIPGMTDTSLLPEAAAKVGISFSQLLSRQLEWAMERFRRDSLLRT